jgi:hypothetical protein
MLFGVSPKNNIYDGLKFYNFNIEIKNKGYKSYFIINTKKKQLI